MPCVLLIPRLGLVRILDTVRNTILDWSLRLEADGILGEEFSFSVHEKEVAAEKAESLRPPVSIIYVENMINSAIQQGSQGAAQNHGRSG